MRGISFYRGLDLNFFQVVCFVHEQKILHYFKIVVVSYKINIEKYVRPDYCSDCNRLFLNSTL